VKCPTCRDAVNQKGWRTCACRRHSAPAWHAARAAATPVAL